MQRVYFVGIKGVGMSGLAVIAKEQGYDVAGCDTRDKFITDKVLVKNQIIIDVGFEKNIKDIDLLIYTAAHQGKNNPAVQSAMKNGIRAISYAQALRELTQGKKMIAVSGTHGKTTTTAMIAKVLRDADLDPGFLIGTGNVPDLKSNAYWGEGKYFVAEADEYVDDPTEKNAQPKFLKLNPYIGVVLSTEYDHPDVFDTPKHYFNAYKKFVKRIMPKGLAIIRADEPNARKIVKSAESKTKVKAVYFNKVVPGLKLKIPGQHNLFNANVAFYACRFLGVNAQQIKKSLNEFLGLERRLEIRHDGKVKIYDDYAHHPTEIQQALSALREKFPNKRLICVFQSHTVSRTKALLKEFGKSFQKADKVIIAPIFLSAREKPDEFTGVDLAHEIQKHHKQCEYADNFSIIIDKLNKEMKNDDVVVTMGAGDIYKIISELISQISKLKN